VGAFKRSKNPSLLGAREKPLAKLVDIFCIRKPPDSLVVLLSFSVESLMKTLLLVLYICDSQLQIKIH
jgi:hypothetical protein